MSDDKRDPPIEALGYVAGVTVVDIGDYRVARGMTRRPFSGCHHRRLVYDTHERRIWCKDCERDVEPFDAFTGLVEKYDEAHRRLVRRSEEVAAAESHHIRSRAAKVLDKAWQHRKMVPACPHCSNGLFPEDFADGIRASLGRDYAKALLTRRKGTPAP